MIGVLYICTGKYDLFWKEFFISSEQFFLPSQEKTYFVFTDAAEIYGEENANVKKIDQQFLGWPDNTLMRFDMFSKIQSDLAQCDYLFFLNANTKFLQEVGSEVLPNADQNGLVAVIHPYFWDKKPDEFTYERNERSTAGITYGLGQHYFMGAFNGGEASAYLQMINTLKQNIEIDLQNGLIAVWHDESHLNHYLLDKNPLALSPSYCAPEDYELPFEPKLQILDKLKYGGHEYMRGA